MKTNGAANETIGRAGENADSQCAQKPLKTSDSRGGFLSGTPDVGVFDSQHSESGERPAPPPRPEKKPDIGPYLEGKLCLVLAMGLSQREAEYWVDHSQSTISRLVRLDERLAQDIHRYTQLVRLFPLLRIAMSTHKTWRASQWLLKFLKARTGEASVDDLLAEFPRLFQKLRPSMFTDEAYFADFEARYPISER
jgi:hypothetical protein